jgi:hypothetical protein
MIGFDYAFMTLQGLEVMNMIRKGQLQGQTKEIREARWH